MDRKREEGAGDSAIMGMCRGRNSVKSDNDVGNRSPRIRWPERHATVLDGRRGEEGREEGIKEGGR